MHAARDQRLGLVEIARLAGEAMRVDQRVDRIAGAAAGSVKVRIPGDARQPGVAAIDPPEPRLAAVVHVDHPVGELDHGGARFLRAGQEVMQHQAGGVVVLRARPAARTCRCASNRRDAWRCRRPGNARCARSSRRCTPRDRDRCGRGRCRRRAREVVAERPPPVIGGLHEPGEEARDRVVLVVVVRNDRSGSRFPDSPLHDPHTARRNSASRIRRSTRAVVRSCRCP